MLRTIAHGGAQGAATVMRYALVMRLIAMSAIAVLATAAALALAPAPVPGSWLDSPSFEGWNAAGAALPSVPQGQKNADPRCRQSARPVESDEDRELHAHGWDLIGQAVESGHIRAIGATADYDGMCRPRQYQYFVFERGVFAGTLSPALMDSRTDGALTRVTIESERQLKAEYLRYAAADPLCCPSRRTTVVFSVGGSPPVLRARSADTISLPAPR